jgi:glycosyltransferase involved in cell wall biosynthesis
MACELRRRGHDVRIVAGCPGAPGTPPHMDQYVYDGLPVERFFHTFTRDDGQLHEFQSEFDNRQVYRWFKQLLATHRPDIVHCIHLSRLSAAPLDACAEAGIPCLFTATDFWAICPTMQLRLPDGSMCRGPEADGANCLQHLLQLQQRRRRGWAGLPLRAASMLPKSVLRQTLRIVQCGWFAKNSSAAGARAVAARAVHVRERLSRVHRLLVPSQIMREMLISHGLPADRVALVPYGIPLELLPRSTERGGSARRPLQIAYVGQIAEHKGVHVLIEAVRRLRPEAPIQLVVHGDLQPHPKYTTRLHRLAKGDPRISFHGRFDHRHVAEALRHADVLVCPSIWYENTPLVIYEALAAGVPVVASDMPGMAELVKPEVNGLLFRAGDAAQLAEILRRLTADRSLVARLAQQTEPPLSVAMHVDRLEDHYHAVLAARCPP